ncbi:MAG: hypothetical protein M0P71_17835 [Melioribacteraceae bacterium]|nr:hypothetical protein [Melioribacteraceae bacterium]
MLLETLDLRNNDILIYSQNSFNFNDNFKIVFKNEKIKRPRAVSYFDVCNYVKDPAPKNLIVYRLLTNVPKLDAYSTKFGYFIRLNDKMELVYFDPIYAIKDLRHLRFELDPDKFRFKIQQVGLTSLTRKENEADFAEVYSFDMKAIEAQNQNDKIFSDAIFAFDENYIDEEYIDDGSSSKEKIKISEDSGAERQQYERPVSNDQEKIQIVREELVTLLKEALGIEKINQSNPPPSGFSDFIKKAKDQNAMDLFKSTMKSNELMNRSVVLKLDETTKETK